MMLNTMMKTFFLLLCMPLIAFAQDVKILSWNVFMIPRPIRFSYQSERTNFIIHELKNESFDIVFLQEAFSKGFRNKIKSSFKTMYPYQSYLGRRKRSLTVYGPGLYVLSKYPIVTRKYAYFSNCADADCFSSKGVELITVNHPSGKKIQFANTHMQSGGKRSQIRFKQLNQIKRLLNTYAVQGIGQVLVGDLNIDALSGNDYSKALALLNMKSHPLEGELPYTNGYPIECYKKPGDDQKQWIDHILVHQDFSGTVKDKNVRVFNGLFDGKECPLSDHYAVEATLSL